MRIEYHRTLIADQVRNRAFHEALRRTIVPGESVVADIGAGTGLIGIMAARLGARHVYLYESEAVAEVARRILKDNRIRNAEVIPIHSAEMVDPPRADVVVSETLGNYALEENIVATLADARKRHLKPGGVLIPSHVAQWAGCVIDDRIARELDVWRTLRDALGIDLEHARTMSQHNIYVRTLRGADLLGGTAGAVCWDTVELGRDGRSTRAGEARWSLSAPTVIHGFALWWTASLAADVSLSTAPNAPPTHWEQLYLPLLTPITAAPGDSVAVHVRSKSSYEGGTHLAWTATLTDDRGRQKLRQAMDLDKGWLP